MDNDFKTIYNNLRAEQEALNAKMQSARGDAIKPKLLHFFHKHLEINFQPLTNP